MVSLTQYTTKQFKCMVCLLHNKNSFIHTYKKNNLVKELPSTHNYCLTWCYIGNNFELLYKIIGHKNYFCLILYLLIILLFYCLFRNNRLQNAHNALTILVSLISIHWVPLLRLMCLPLLKPLLLSYKFYEQLLLRQH